MRILAKLTPSNKLQIKRYRIAEGYCKRKTAKPSSEIVELNRLGLSLNNVISSRSILSYNSLVRNIGAGVNGCPVNQLGLIQSSSEDGLEPNPSGEFCFIPQKVEYADCDSKGFWTIEEEEYECFRARYARSLDILKKSQQKKKSHCNWGVTQKSKVFRWQGAEKIREGGAVIDRFVGKHHSSMLTLTIPGGTREAFKAVADWSGWIANRLLQVIRRVPKSLPPVHWFFVWEHQKRGALHLHMCLAWKVHSEDRYALAEAIKNKWFECLLELEEKCGVDAFQPLGFRPSWRNVPSVWQWDCQEISKSVAGYFSKYCQKNSQINGQEPNVKKRGASPAPARNTKTKKYEDIHYPSRYWGSSQSIKRWVKRLTHSIMIETYTQEETERVYTNIVSASMHNIEVEDIIETEFQVIEPSTGVCISSGSVDTFRIPVDAYPAFWVRVMQSVFERDVCMDAMMKEFLGDKLFASMQ